MSVDNEITKCSSYRKQEHNERQTMRTKKTTLDIGCISEGTLRPVDIIPELLWALKPLRLTRTDRATVRKIDIRYEAASEHYAEEELLGFYVSELFDLAENYCPDYCYFGAVEGDGACIGVWPIADLFDDTRPGGYDGCLHYGDDPPTDPEETIMAMPRFGVEPAGVGSSVGLLCSVPYLQDSLPRWVGLPGRMSGAIGPTTKGKRQC
jgi:hypothetical protein